MGFGIYVHIPYCLQRCVYCDFATYEAGLANRILPPEIYVERVKKEVALKAAEIGPRPLNTLYYGGGTPSLLDPAQLIAIKDELARQGFPLAPNAEVTLEINPATLDETKVDQLLNGGFNRFSVGAQSFSDALLKVAHRKHSAQDTRDTLSLLRRKKVNFSLDVLFALPGQTLEILERDLDEALSFEPNHVSPYCLTVPDSNPLYKGRPLDEIQVKMFDVIDKRLTGSGLQRYEISNYARPGFESRHNLLYWNDDEYWGIGLSSHSYLHRFEWGCRFWNPRGLEQYDDHVRNLEKNPWTLQDLPEAAGEILGLHQALTDFIHTGLRLTRGMSLSRFEKKFKTPAQSVLGPSLAKLSSRGLIAVEGDFVSLTPQGVLVSNQVFQEFTFLPEDAKKLAVKSRN